MNVTDRQAAAVLLLRFLDTAGVSGQRSTRCHPWWMSAADMESELAAHLARSVGTITDRRRDAIREWVKRLSARAAGPLRSAAPMPDTIALAVAAAEDEAKRAGAVARRFRAVLGGGQ